jgi:hypothetical protein
MVFSLLSIAASDSKHFAVDRAAAQIRDSNTIHPL